MIRHDDWDSLDDPHKEPYVLPERIDKIEFSYDGGRLAVTINDQEVYASVEGTRDCHITLDRDE